MTTSSRTLGRLRHPRILSRVAWPACVAVVTLGLVVTGCGASEDVVRPVRSTPPVRATRLLAQDGRAGDTFGGARWYDTFSDPVKPVYYATPGEAAISSNGDVAVVGAPGAAVADKEGAGAAYVFARSRSGWSQVAKLTALDASEHDALGWTVAISGAGDEVLAGAPYADLVDQQDQGAVYSFRATGGQWSQAQKLTGSDSAAYSEFGWSVALARRGGHALVGSPGQTVGAAGAGAAYVFASAPGAGTWSETHRLTAADPRTDAQFGAAAGLSADGAVAAVTESTHQDRDSVLHVGSTSLFGTGDDWTTATLLARFEDTNRNKNGETDAYGVDLSVSDRGDAVAVAAPDDDSGRAVAAGAAHVYGTTCRWQRADCRTDLTLTARRPVAYQYYGSSVALAAEGTTLLVGNDGAGSNGQGEGELVVLGRSGARLRHRAAFTAPDVKKGRFGTAVALSASGSTGLATAPWLPVHGNARQGAAYVLTFAPAMRSP